MELIDFYTKCKGCNGTGVRTYINEQKQTTTEDPCTICGGEKFVDNKRGGGIDATALLQILANQVAIIADLDYIHGKVTAIWNKVK
jgi:hypothetical protein